MSMSTIGTEGRSSWTTWLKFTCCVEAHQNGKDLTRAEQRQVLLERECQQKRKRLEIDQNCVDTDGMERPSTMKKFTEERLENMQLRSKHMKIGRMSSRVTMNHRRQSFTVFEIPIAIRARK
ncbi:hypothetical protein E2562_023379 [Oryza meyeriana var. granulata]|uniref:Uncharacterized protein n=1 Tax=Oryza meyeriana var. granulata TaxID=110450 RepID=A0A6G1DZK1_9ORYZ|nr:hypothetical protein E2562_023379 [Oryza meyeriana var. granulata]